MVPFFVPQQSQKKRETERADEKWEWREMGGVQLVRRSPDALIGQL